MDSRSGKNIRLSRLFDAQAGKSLVVAYSHGSFIGPLDGMESLEVLQRNAALMSRAEGLLISPGLVRHLEPTLTGRGAPSLVLHLDWMNFTREVLVPDRLAVASMATIEQAVSAGADAVMVFLYYGDPDLESAQVTRLADVSRLCDKFGLALIVEPRSAREAQRVADESDRKILVAFSRMSAELGADIVKCVWRGPVERLDELAEVAQATPAPVFLAGGALRADFREVLEATAQAEACGFQGLVYGRNLFQSPHPDQALAAVRSVFHDRRAVDDVVADFPALFEGPPAAGRGASSRY